MNVHDADSPAPETVVVDGLLLADAHWLIAAVEEFTLFGEPTSIHGLIAHANRHLSPDGLSRIAGELAVGLRRAIETSR